MALTNLEEKYKEIANQKYWGDMIFATLFGGMIGALLYKLLGSLMGMILGFLLGYMKYKQNLIKLEGELNLNTKQF